MTTSIQNASIENIFAVYFSLPDLQKLQGGLFTVISRISSSFDMETCFIEYFRLKNLYSAKSLLVNIANQLNLHVNILEFNSNNLNILNILTYSSSRFEFDFKNLVEINSPSNQLIDFLFSSPIFLRMFEKMHPPDQLRWCKQEDILKCFNPNFTIGYRINALERVSISHLDEIFKMIVNPTPIEKNIYERRMIDKNILMFPYVVKQQIDELTHIPNFLHYRKKERWNEFKKLINPKNDDFIKFYSQLENNNDSELAEIINAPNFKPQIFLSRFRFNIDEYILKTLLETKLTIENYSKLLSILLEKPKPSFNLINKLLSHQPFITEITEVDIKILSQFHVTFFHEYLSSWLFQQRLSFLDYLIPSKLPFKFIRHITSGSLTKDEQLRIFKIICSKYNFDRLIINEFIFDINNNLLCLFLCVSFPNDCFSLYFKFSEDARVDTDILQFINASNINYLLKHFFISPWLIEQIIYFKSKIIQFINVKLDQRWEPGLRLFLNVCKEELKIPISVQLEKISS